MMMNYGKKLWVLHVLVGLGLIMAANAGAQGLIGLWEFEEGSGETVADSSGNGNNGTIFNPGAGLGENGSVWANDPDRGAVLSFAGGEGGSYVLLGESLIPVMTFDQDFTWMFWAKQVNVTEPNHIILGNRMNVDPADFEPRQFIKFTPTKFEWHMNGNGDDNMEYDDIPNDVWFHHAVVKRGAQLTYYRNGIIAGSGVITQELAEPQPLFIGGDNEGSAGENWIGYIDNVRIYDKAISSEAIASILANEWVGASGAGDWSLKLR